MKKKFYFLLAAAMATSLAQANPVSLPYYNPCEDLATVTSCGDTGYSNSWVVYSYGSGTSANSAFAIVPGVTTNSASFTATATLWTEELDLQAGKTYKVSAVMGAWWTASAAQQYLKHNIALYASPSLDAEYVELGSYEQGTAYNASKRPTYTVYFKADGTKRYLGFGNRGGGKVNRFGVDDITVAEIDGSTPDVVTDLAATVSGKDVTISFTLPTKNVVNEDLASIDKVQLLRGDRVINEWTDRTPGEALSFVDNVTSVGDYAYTVVCINNGSESEETSVSVTVPLGGNLQTPTKNSTGGSSDTNRVNGAGSNYFVAATYLPGEGIKLDWMYPLSTYNANQIPEGEDNLIGTITRLNDGVVLTEENTGATYTDKTVDLAQRTVYQYQGDLQRYTYSQTAYSNVVSINNPMPFYPSVSANSLNEFTIIDYDGDLTTWNAMTTGNAKYHVITTWFNCGNNASNNNGVDWMITPGLLVEKGKTYRVDVDALVNTLIETPSQFQVSAGRSNSAEAMTETIIPLTKFKHLTPQTYSGYYTATDDENIFFGFAAIENSAAIGLTNIGVYEVSNDIPAAVDAINVTYSPTTAGQATLAFNAPSKNIVGEDLANIDKIVLYLNDEEHKVYDNPTPGEEFTEDVTFELGQQDTYKVISYAAGGESLPTSVNVMVLEPPYTNTFDSAGDAIGWTVIDPHESGYTWGYMATNKAMRCYPEPTVKELGDYLITPPVHLEKGYFYKIDFTTGLASADTDNYYDNQLEILIGKAPTAEAMTETIKEPFYVRGGFFSSKELAKEWFSVPETGEYYIAWRALCDPGFGQEIYIDNLEIGEKFPDTYPGAVTDMVVAPDSDGALKATVTFNIPTTDMAGNPLDGNVYYTELLRDGEQIAYWTSQEPGAAIAFTDENPTLGEHQYTATCYGGTSTSNMVGTRDTDILVFVGVNRPGAVSFLNVVEDPENWGTVTFTWGAPETDMDGYPLNTKGLTYSIGEYNYNSTTGEATVTYYVEDFTPGEDGKLEYTKQVKSSPEDQSFMRFVARANTSAGYGTPIMRTSYMAVGKPFALPFTESFKNSNAEHTMCQEYPYDGYYCSWGYNTKNDVTGVYPVDDDNGLAMFETIFAKQGARLYTARVDLSIENPQVSFYIYNQTNSENTDNNTLGISVREGLGSFQTVEEKSVNDWADGKPGWQKAIVDLSDYAGKTVYLGLDGFANNMTFIHFDRMVVGAPNETDLAVTNMTQDTTYVGIDHNVKVTVKNNGTAEAKTATVTLRLDGAEVGTLDVPAIAPGNEAVLVFTNNLGRDEVGVHEYTAEVAVDGDADLYDNTASAGEFNLKTNDFPTVRNLQGEKAGSMVTLEWDEPVLPDAAAEITDDFESYPSWSTMYSGIGDYTLIDRDGYEIGGFTNFELPNIAIGSTQSFTLWDFTYEPFEADTRYRAHSGDKCLVSIYNPAAYEWTDDILISPVLTGDAQTISFWAKALGDSYPESFQVYYSTKGSSVSDFTESFKQVSVGGDWVKYSYDLPEGAKYFMINHYSRGGYFFFVDDLTYTPVGDESLNLQGYNVYREEEKLNESPVTFKAWVDKSAKAESLNNYSVTAVYDRGESPAQTIGVDTTGIDELTAAGIRVTVENHDIVISGAQGLDIAVVNMSGMVLTNRKAEDVTRISVQTGVYVVTVNGKPMKVVVR